MDQEGIYVGIDVAKAQVDVAVRPTDDSWEVSYDDAGVRQGHVPSSGVRVRHPVDRGLCHCLR